MSSLSSDPPVTLARWPFPVLLLLLLGGLWLLDTHQPAAWTEAATPWFEQVRSVWPAATLVDQVNARAAVTPDLPLGSTLALLLTATIALATLLAIDIPPLLAIAVVLGLAATRTVWSTASAGQDCLAVGVVAAAVLAIARPPGTRVTALTTALGVVLAPATAWLVLPAVARTAASRRRRWIGAAALVGLAACAQTFLLRYAWGGVACLSSGRWTSAVADVLVPGQSANASAWLAIRQALAVLTGDVHLFGVLVAVLGLVRASGAARRLRPPTLAAIALGLVVIATGLVPPALGAALWLPWWAPWFARGLQTLVGDVTGRLKPLATAFAVIVALVSPLLRHATVTPAPFVTGTPNVADATSRAWQGAVVASERADLARRLRRAGAITVPAETDVLAQCVATRRPVLALGTTVQHVEHLGYRITEHPLRAPLGAVLRDVRANQLVALGLSPGASAWVGAPGLAVLPRVSVSRETLVGAPAVSVVARTDRGGEVRTGRGGIDLTLPPGVGVGGQSLLAPLSVGAREGDVAISSAHERLATSRHAALVVYDRGHAIALRSVGHPAPGLPVPLMRHASWRQVSVTGAPVCVAASREWTPLTSAARRISVPTAGASAASPVLIYLASATRPTVTVAGLPSQTLRPGWTAEAFHTRIAEEAQRLRTRQEQDDVPPALRPQAPWVTRISLTPRAAWDAQRVAVSAGVPLEGWLMRLATGGDRWSSTSVCAMASPGDRLLQGQYGVLDDESDREIAVWATDGWHPAERLHGEVFQWTAQPSATASFWLDAPVDLTLAMDATGAGISDQPQPVAVKLNGAILKADWQGAARLTLPASALRVGDNTLALDVERVVQPERDPRALGVLVKQLRLIGPTLP